MHERLAGTVKLADASGRMRAVWRTTLAGAYPAPLCRAWAQTARKAAGAACIDVDGPPLGADLAAWEADLCRCCGDGVVSGFIPRCPPGAPPEWPPDAPSWDLRRNWILPRAA
eukprot:13967909-Heterocapsa_arctica.AAC.1